MSLFSFIKKEAVFGPDPQEPVFIQEDPASTVTPETNSSQETPKDQFSVASLPVKYRMLEGGNPNDEKKSNRLITELRHEFQRKGLPYISGEFELFLKSESYLKSSPQEHLFFLQAFKKYPEAHVLWALKQLPLKQPYQGCDASSRHSIIETVAGISYYAAHPDSAEIRQIYEKGLTEILSKNDQRFNIVFIDQVFKTAQGNAKVAELSPQVYDSLLKTGPVQITLLPNYGQLLESKSFQEAAPAAREAALYQAQNYPSAKAMEALKDLTGQEYYRTASHKDQQRIAQLIASFAYFADNTPDVGLRLRCDSVLSLLLNRNPKDYGIKKIILDERSEDPEVLAYVKDGQEVHYFRRGLGGLRATDERDPDYLRRGNPGKVEVTIHEAGHLGIGPQGKVHYNEDDPVEHYMTELDSYIDQAHFYGEPSLQRQQKIACGFFYDKNFIQAYSDISQPFAEKKLDVIDGYIALLEKRKIFSFEGKTPEEKQKEFFKLVHRFEKSALERAKSEKKG